MTIETTINLFPTLYRVYWPDIDSRSDRTFRTREAAEQYGSDMGMSFEVVLA